MTSHSTPLCHQFHSPSPPKCLFFHEQKLRSFDLLLIDSIHPLQKILFASKKDFHLLVEIEHEEFSPLKDLNHFLDKCGNNSLFHKHEIVELGLQKLGDLQCQDEEI